MRWELFGARRACQVVFVYWPLKRPVRRKLVAVSGEGFLDLLAHGFAEDGGATECANSLLALTRGEMARAGGAVFDFSIGRDAEPLLRAFVCFLLGHGRFPNRGVFGVLG